MKNKVLCPCRGNETAVFVNNHCLKRNLRVGIIAMLFVLLFTFLPTPVFFGLPSSVARAEEPLEIPAKGMVTLVDLGAKKCIPCKMMAPILEKLEKTYRGRAVIHFYDVWENPEPAKRFGIRGIPTQIFFDEEGKEVFRHAGFMSEEAIVNQLTKMGVK